MNSFQQEEMLYLAALMDIDSQVAFAGIHESSQLLLLGNKYNQGSSKLILFGNDCNQGWMHGHQTYGAVCFFRLLAPGSSPIPSSYLHRTRLPIHIYC